MNARSTAVQVANYLILKARTEKEGDLTNMKLQKLLYFAQGLFLAGTEGKQLLFDDPIEAWKYGPVIPSVYQQLSGFGENQINVFLLDKSGNIAEFESLDKDVKYVADYVWNKYGHYDSYRLSSMTHRPDTPWKNTIINKRGFFRSRPEIDVDEMKKYFVPA